MIHTPPASFVPRERLWPDPARLVSRFRCVVDTTRTQPVREIIAEVSRKHGLTAADIVGERKLAPIARARREAILEAFRRRPDLTVATIGKAFRRDRTTVLYVLKANTKS